MGAIQLVMCVVCVDIGALCVDYIQVYQTSALYGWCLEKYIAHCGVEAKKIVSLVADVFELLRRHSEPV